MFKRKAKEPREPEVLPTYEEKMVDLMVQQLRCLQSLRENIRFFVLLALLIIVLQVLGWII